MKKKSETVLFKVPMLKVGITGGIGSGKTTICRIWEELGAKVIYADDLAKRLMVEDPVLKKELISAFGPRSYKENGELNRTYLAEVAFKKGRVEEFNQIIHPRVLKQTEEIAREAKAQGIKVLVKEAALLLKYGRPADLDYVVLVTADTEERLKRVVLRDHTKAEKVSERMQKQQHTDELRKYADIIINNNGSLENLKEKAKNIFLEFLEEAGTDKK
jgi:dephospho-CoA kinase